MNIDDHELENKINNIKDILDGKDEIIELVDIYSTTMPESIVDASYSNAQNKILQSIKENIKGLNLFYDENNDEDTKGDLKFDDIKDYLDDWLKNKLPNIVEEIVTEKMRKNGF